MNIRTSMIAGCMVLALASPKMNAGCYHDCTQFYLPKTAVESYIMTAANASLLLSLSYLFVMVANARIEESRADQKRLDAQEARRSQQVLGEDEQEDNDGEVEWVE